MFRSASSSDGREAPVAAPFPTERLHARQARLLLPPFATGTPDEYQPKPVAGAGDLAHGSAGVETTDVGGELSLVEQELAYTRDELALAQQDLAFHTAALQVLAAPLSTPDRMRRLLRLLISSRGDWAAVDWLDAGQPLRVVVQRDDRLNASAAALEAAAGGSDPLWRAVHAVRGDVTRLYASVTVEKLAPGVPPERQEWLRQLGLRSVLILSLQAQGQRLGALTLGAGEGHPEFTPATVARVQDLAVLLALALLSCTGEDGCAAPRR